MWETERHELSRQERALWLLQHDAKLRTTAIPIGYMERVRTVACCAVRECVKQDLVTLDADVKMQRATSHCRGDMKYWVSPPREVYCQDCAGKTLAREVVLRDEPGANNDWIVAIAAHASTLDRTAIERCVSLDVSGTAITDAGITVAVSTLKHIRRLAMSRCAAVTDESVTAARRFLSRKLEELRIDECRRITGDIMIQLWRDCDRLHVLSAAGCPGMTDRFLQTLASTPRAAPEYRVKSVDIRRCRNVTSSGIAHLAAASAQHVALEYLRIGDCKGIDPMAFFGFEDSTALVHSLTTLDLRGLPSGINETAISWIAKGCAAAPHFARLILARCSQISDFALLLLAPVITSPNFWKLDLQECTRITDRGIHDLFSTARARAACDSTADSPDSEDNEEGFAQSIELRSLNLRNCTAIGDSALDCIGSHCPHLLKLNLKGLRKVSDCGVMSIAKGCPRLEKLTISGRYITTQTFKVLGKMCRKLETLDVSERGDLDTPECFLYFTSTPTCGRSAFHTPETSFLRRIDLSTTNCCDVGVSLIAVACRKLEWINLSKCAKITDVALEALASCCFQLKVLLVAHVRSITDRSLIACGVTRLPLQVMDLSGNTKITDDGILGLCSSCQQLQELRLHGCDRLSAKVVKRCNIEYLPLTRPFISATMIKTLATGGGNVSMALEPLPDTHVGLLSRLELQYRSAQTLQMRFRRWKQKSFSVQFLARRRLLRESRAVKKIQKCVREFLAWRRFLHLLQIGRHCEIVIFVQAHTRGLLDRKSVRIKRFTENRAAKTIQRGYRPHYRIRMRIRNYYALEIQRVYRGYRARELRKQLTRERQERAVDHIATWYRRCKCHIEMRERSRWLVKMVRSIQGQWRVHRDFTRFWQHVDYYRQRAIKIQSIWRQKLAVVHVHAMRIAMNAAALIIQRVYRGHRSRLWTRHYREIGNRSACRVQAQWRRYSARCSYLRSRHLIIRMQRMGRYTLAVRRLRLIVRGAVDLRRNCAAKSIQRVYRGHLGRRRAVLFRKIRNAKVARRGQNASQALLRRKFVHRGAALRIQNWVRSILGRRKMLKLRRWKRFLAASRIQRYLKRWMQRLRVRRRREAHTHAATSIERVFRGHRGRLRFRRVEHEHRCQRAALDIQRMYRGYRGRCAFRHLHRESHAAASLLQRAFRTRQARKLYEISLAVKALKAKEQYDKSLMGWIDTMRNPMEELYRRARIPREKAVLEELKAKWEAHRAAEEKALRKLQRQCHAAESGAGDESAWQRANEAVANELAVRRKLYGVTENVYTTHQELRERSARRAALSNQLEELRARVAAFKRGLREAAAAKRMLDAAEVAELLREFGLQQQADVELR